MGIQGWQWLLILAVILLLFGAAKLPALAKSMGQSARVFKGEMKAMKDEDSAAKDDAGDQTKVANSEAAEPARPESGGASSSSSS